MDLLRSLPLGLYLEQPVTWLHHLDTRVKLAWLMSFLLMPLLATPFWRLLLTGLLILLTLAALIPLRVWRQQMGWLLILCCFVFILTAIAPDGLAADHQPRLPTDEVTFAQQPAKLIPPIVLSCPWYNPFCWGQQPATSPSPSVPIAILSQPTSYRYVLLEQGPFKVTQRSLDLALRLSTLLFTLIYSTSLYLLTTASEEITTGLESLMQPLRRLNVPVTEITLTLTLSLRFIPLVLEEIQNLMRSVQTRAINWKKIGFRGSTQIWLTIAQRLIENLLLRAAQIASAMKVRGFTSPDQHQVKWHQLQLKTKDWLALICLVLLWSARIVWGGES